MAQTVVSFTTGSPGTGKSYRRGSVETMNFLKNDPAGVSWSNFPLYPDKIAVECNRRYKKPVEHYRSRIRVIPHEVIQSWTVPVPRRENSHMAQGPWKFFASIPAEHWEENQGANYPFWVGRYFPDDIEVFTSDEDGKRYAHYPIDGSHIAFDEVHNFAHESMPKHQRQLWRTFFGEIRHRGCTVECLTQSPDKACPEIQSDADISRTLENCTNLYDPVFKISMGDWYQFLAVFLRSYEVRIRQTEFRKVTTGQSRKGVWQINKRETFTLNPYYFQFYNSHNSPVAGGKGSKPKLLEWQTKKWYKFFLWFGLKNFWSLFSRFAVIGVVLWLVAFGGGKALFNGITGYFNPANKTAIKKPVVKSSPGQPLYTSTKTLSIPKSGSSLNPAKPVDKTMLLVEEIRKRDLIIKELQAELDRLRLAGSVLASLTPDSIIFANGLSYCIGEVIDFGPFKNLKVAKINWRRRQAVLNDGTLLSLYNE